MSCKYVVVGAVAMLALAAVARAQDAVVVDPAHHKVEYENDQVRVLRVTFPPGEHSQMHQHPCLIAIGIEDSLLTFHFPDGSEREAPLKKGQVVVAKPTTHSPENRTSKPVEVVVVELKNSACQ